VFNNKQHSLMKNLILVFVAIATISFSFITRPTVRPSSTVVSRALVFPVAGTRSVIKDKWGASRAGGIRRHKGIDIHARKGTPVVAVCDGVITDREQGGLGGKALWLKSPKNAWSAYYAHLDKQYVKEGQWVHKGQVIGTVGNTGNARTTPSHLHFGVKKGGSWVNPLPYVKGATKVAVKRSPAKKTAAKRVRR
jgi:murein DD-endopeptidase MepM/ murein hydrolase activator NlpD